MKRNNTGSLKKKGYIPDYKHKRRLTSPEEIQVLIKYKLDEYIRG